MASRLSTFAEQLGVKEEDMINLVFNSTVEIDKERIWNAHKAIEEGVLSLPRSIADIGAGNVTETIRGDDFSTTLEISQRHMGSDISVCVTSSTTPVYIVRVMQGMCLEKADRYFVRSGRGKFNEGDYEVRYSPFNQSNEVVVTKSGLLVYNGQKTKKRILARSKVSAYLSVGESPRELFDRVYVELGPWLRVESLSDNYRRIAYQLRLLPNAVKMSVGSRVQEVM